MLPRVKPRRVQPHNRQVHKRLESATWLPRSMFMRTRIKINLRTSKRVMKTNAFNLRKARRKEDSSKRPKLASNKAKVQMQVKERRPKARLEGQRLVRRSVQLRVTQVREPPSVLLAAPLSAIARKRRQKKRPRSSRNNNSRRNRTSNSTM